MLGLSDVEAFNAFGKGLACNTKLIWLDLSHNQMTLKERFWGTNFC